MASPPSPGPTPTPGLRLEPGAHPLPGYELVERLGKGGFGEVWKVKGPGGVPLALKFISLEGNAGAIEQRALNLMMNVRHPHLLGVFGVWQQQGYLILALELADRTLMQRFEEARVQGAPGIPRNELWRYLYEAASALDHLNGQGIQHRDVKPQNILLVGGGVKVADFGLAKLLEHTQASNTGHYTPYYAAPEFFNGQTSPRSDQYCLAVSYCQLRGGRTPFEGNLYQLAYAHVNKAPDLDMLPEAERVVVARALAKQPEERWPSCQAFVQALAVSAPSPEPPPAPTPPAPIPVDIPPTLSDPPQKVPFPKPGEEREWKIAAGLRMTFCWIPPGTAQLGSPAAEREAVVKQGMIAEMIQEEAEDKRGVYTSKGFWLGKYTVTQQEWTAVMDGHNPSYFCKGADGQGRVPEVTSRFPVETLSWDDCQEFLEKLNQRAADGAVERVFGRRGRFVLPHEDEWEYACRGGLGNKQPYYFGSVLDGRQANCNGNYPYGATTKGPYLERPAEVGSYARDYPHPWGLCDMHGNIWQWCENKYNFYSRALRVMRGGSWSSDARGCRAANRLGMSPDLPVHFHGCRLCFRLD